MFIFYVLSVFKKRDTIQGGTLFKGGHYLRKYGKLQYFQEISMQLDLVFDPIFTLCNTVIP